MLDIRFDNLEEVKRFYDPIVVEKAARSTIKQLHNKAATQVSKEVRQIYNVKARDIKSVLKTHIVNREGVPVGFLVYTGRRLSLRYFSTVTQDGNPQGRGRPKVKTTRGTRRGARARIRKDRPARVFTGAFWGRGRAGQVEGAGQYQIFKRVGLSRLPIKKLKGPSIAQMVRSQSAIDSVNDLVNSEATERLVKNLDFFTKRKAGIF